MIDSENGNQLKNIGDLMSLVMEDRLSVLKGDVDDSKARILVSQQRVLLKAVELRLQFMRIKHGKKPERDLPLIES